MAPSTLICRFEPTEITSLVAELLAWSIAQANEPTDDVVPQVA